MDYKVFIMRILPKWTLLNLVVTGISIVSAVIIYFTQNVLPQGLDILQLTVVGILNIIFILYWSLWFIFAVPPIAIGLYFRNENEGYYILAVQNLIAVVILYGIKIVFNFDLSPIVG